MSANKETIAQWIRGKKTALGIEFGSTRIKAVLVGEDHTPIASGAHDWENRLTDGIWTYTLEDIWTGIQDAYAKLAEDVKSQYLIRQENFWFRSAPGEIPLPQRHLRS